MNRRTAQRITPALVLLAAGCGITIRGGSTAANRGGVPNAQGGPGKGIVGPAAGLAIDSNGNLLAAGGGVSRSVDGGQTWQPLPVPASLHADRIRRVAATTAAPDNVYAAGPGAGVLRSAGGGQTWRSLSAGLPSQEVVGFAVHSFRPDTLYTWLDGKGVFRTEDGGGRWQKMDDGPPAAVANLVHSTLEGSMNTGWLYAATPEGVYLSMD